MLFTADGDQAVIGPDKLRVTGIPTSATCRFFGNITHLLVKLFFRFEKKKILTTDVNSTGAIWFDGRFMCYNPTAKDKDGCSNFHNHSCHTVGCVDTPTYHE